MSRGTINFGHGQRANGTFDPGAIGATGTRECDVVRAIGQIVVSELQRLGHTINAIQSGDLSAITASANNFKSDWFVSIHANAFDENSHGTEVHVCGLGGNAEKLAKSILNEAIAACGLTNRGIKVTNLYVNKYTNMPSCLVETAFISNPTEEALLKNPTWQRKMAIAIVKGIQAYLGLSYTSQSVPETWIIKINDVQKGSFTTVESVVAEFNRLRDQAEPGTHMIIQRLPDGVITTDCTKPFPAVVSTTPSTPEPVVEPIKPAVVEPVVNPPVVNPVEPQPTNDQIEQGIGKALISLIKQVLIYLKIIKE